MLMPMNPKAGFSRRYFSMTMRAIILGAFAVLLVLMAIFYNTTGGETAEGGGPCFGVAALIFIVLLIGFFSRKKPARTGKPPER